MSVSLANPPGPTAETMNEFCEALGISRSFAYRLIRDGKLRTVKLGARTLVPLSERARLLEQAPPVGNNQCENAA